MARPSRLLMEAIPDNQEAPKDGLLLVGCLGHSGNLSYRQRPVHSYRQEQ